MVDVVELYKKAKENGGKKGGGRVGGRAEEIRKAIRALLEQGETVYLGALTRALMEAYEEKNYRKVRGWIVQAVSAKCSGLKLEKTDEGYVIKPDGWVPDTRTDEEKAMEGLAAMTA